MRKKFFATLMIVTAFAVTGCTSNPQVELPEEHSTANKPGFGDEARKYLVEGNNNVCVYTLEEDIVWLLVTENADAGEDRFPCYADAFEMDLGGTPVAIAQDLSSVLIKNEDGTFKVQMNVRGDDEETDISPTKFDANTDKTVYIDLYSE